MSQLPKSPGCATPRYGTNKSRQVNFLFMNRDTGGLEQKSAKLVWLVYWNFASVLDNEPKTAERRT